LTVGHTASGGEQVAELALNARVVKDAQYLCFCVASLR